MSKKVTPRVSIITLHHVGTLLFDFVDSVKRHCQIPYEIIVITDDEELATEGIPGCSVHWSKALPAEKRNMGARLAKAPNLAFFDDDVEITPGCVENMFMTLIDAGCGMVYGKLHKFGTTRFDEAGGYLTWNGFIWSRAEQNIQDTGQYNEECEILAGKSASCMVRKYVFNEVGGFDESFGILGEETDLSWRIWLKGYKVMYCPKSLAHHKFNTPLKPFKKFYNSERVHYNGCRNYITMLLKNLGKEHLWIVPIHSMIWFTVGLAMLLTGKPRIAWNIWRGLGYVVRNFRTILKKRTRIQEGRNINEFDLWPSIYRTTSGSYYWTRFCRYIGSGLHG